MRLANRLAGSNLLSYARCGVDAPRIIWISVSHVADEDVGADYADFFSAAARTPIVSGRARQRYDYASVAARAQLGTAIVLDGAAAFKPKRHQGSIRELHFVSMVVLRNHIPLDTNHIAFTGGRFSGNLAAVRVTRVACFQLLRGPSISTNRD
jgi:hypothetical protein